MTRGEYFRLKYRLFRIKNARRIAKFDGYVSFRERARLHRMLDRNSRRINRLRNNGRYAGFGRYGRRIAY